MKGYNPSEFIGYCPALAEGTTKFTDGELPKDMLKHVLFVESVGELIEVSKDLVANYDHDEAEKTRESIAQAVFESQMDALLRAIGGR